ncbi:hypothetical protein TrLO_g8392 [Triparma laevis f. longispina]|uniref:Uncharacterized protein n=1 Tax=Triparma laevis f. longispina TaxID=1714387 RepID=A0A9W7AWU9_9STRA|nr:hypothetical protein TrLO_g8392 [Triparma laevis f. longispina]
MSISSSLSPNYQSGHQSHNQSSILQPANPLGTLTHLHSLRSTTLPLSTVTFNPTQNHILATYSGGATLWSLRKILKEIRFGEEAPAVRQATYSTKHSVYLLLFSLYRPRKTHSRPHPDSCLIKILHTNLQTLASFRPHGRTRTDMCIGMSFLQTSNLICTSGEDKKVCVWELHEDVEEEEEEGGGVKILEVTPVAELNHHEEFGPAQNITSFTHNSQGYCMASAGSTLVIWTANRTDVRLKVIIENISVPSLKITSLAYVDKLGVLVGQADGTVNVWQCDISDTSVHKDKKQICSFKAHRSTGSSVGVSNLTATTDTTMYADCGKIGQTTVVTAGGDGHVRQWKFEDIKSITHQNPPTSPSLIRAVEIGGFKLQMEPPNHFTNELPKKQKRRMKRIEELSMSASIIDATLPVGTRRMCVTTIGGLVSLLEMKTPQTKSPPILFTNLIQSLQKIEDGRTAVLEGGRVRIVGEDELPALIADQHNNDPNAAVSFALHAKQMKTLAGYKNGQLKCGEDVWIKRGPSITGCLFTGDNGKAVTTDADGGVKFWSTKSQKPKILTSEQGHAGPIVALSYSTSTHQVVTAGKNGVVKLWDTKNATGGDLIGFFVVSADVTSAAVVRDNVVGVGFDSGDVQGWVVSEKTGKGVLKSNSCFSAAKISGMDGFDYPSSSSNATTLTPPPTPGIIAASSLDNSVMLFLGTPGGLKPFRRVLTRLPLDTVKLVQNSNDEIFFVASSGRSVIKMKAVMDGPAEILQPDPHPSTNDGFDDTTLDNDFDSLEGGSEHHSPITPKLMTPADQRQYSKVSEFMKEQRGASDHNMHRVKLTTNNKPNTFETIDRPWTANDNADFLAEGHSPTSRPHAHLNASSSPTGRISPNVVLATSPSPANNERLERERPSSPTTSLLDQSSMNQSISLPPLDGNESVNTQRSNEVNLSVASFQNSETLSAQATKHKSLTQARRSKAAARKADMKKPPRKRLPDWSTLRRDSRLKSAFEANDPYRTGRISADLLPMILRWWWPETCDSKDGDFVIARAMETSKIGMESNITVAQMAQVAAAICKEKNGSPPPQQETEDTNQHQTFKSPEKKKRRKYKEMNQYVTKTVFNAVGEPQRVKINVVEDNTLPPNSKTSLTSTQRRFNAMLKVQRNAHTQIPHAEFAAYAPYASKTLFQQPSILSVPSTFLPFWKSQPSLSETRKLKLHEQPEAVSPEPEPETIPDPEPERKLSALAAMYAKPEEPAYNKTPPKAKKIVQKPRAMDLNKTVRIVRQLFALKSEADREANLHQFLPLPLPKVTYTHYLQQFGFANLAENRLTLLFDAVSINFEGSSILRVFARALDLYGEIQNPPLPKSRLPGDLEGMFYEMKGFVQDRDLVVDGVLVPSEVSGSGGNRGGGRNEVRSQCITRRNMELCFRATVSADGRHFSPSCILAVGQLILDMPDINLAAANGAGEQGDIGADYSLTYGYDSTTNLGSSIELSESGSFQHVPTNLVDFDGLIDLEDTLEAILLEVQRWDLESKRIGDACFGADALPDYVRIAQSRDISRPNTREAITQEEAPPTDQILEVTHDRLEEVENWKDSVLTSFGAVRAILTSFALYDDQRTGCVPINVFSEVCRNGGSGSWKPWGIPPLYAHSIQNRPPPGTPGSNLGENPLKPVMPHPSDEEVLCEEEVSLQQLIKVFFDPIEGSVCFLDFVGLLYSCALDGGKLPPFSNLAQQSLNPTRRGLEGHSAKLIVNFMSSLRLIETSCMFNVQGVTMGESTHMLLEGSLEKDFQLKSGTASVKSREGGDGGISTGWSLAESSDPNNANANADNIPTDPLPNPGERVVEVSVSAPPSRQNMGSSQGGQRFGSNEDYQQAARTQLSRGRSRGASRGASRGDGMGSSISHTRSGPVGGSSALNTPMNAVSNTVTTPGGTLSLESFWSGASEFQSLPGGNGVDGGPSAHSDFGFAPAEPDDISLGAAALAKRMSSLEARPKTAIYQHDITDHNPVVVQSIHKHEDPQVPSLSRMLQNSAKVVRHVPGAASGREGRGLKAFDDTVSVALKTSPVRKFQKDLVRVMSSPGGKRLVTGGGNSRKRKSASRSGFGVGVGVGVGNSLSRRPTTTGGGMGSRMEATNVYFRFPGVEPLRCPLSAAGSKAQHIAPKFKANLNDFVDMGLLFDESAVGKYDVFGRPLSPLKGLTTDELEAERMRLLAEAEARRLRAEQEAERLRLEEEERLRRLAEEEEERRRKEEEERRRLMEEKLRQEEEFKRKREEAERLRKAELDRLAAEEAERQRILAEKLAAEEAAKRAREEAARKRREEEEARLAAIQAEKEKEAKAATVIQSKHRARLGHLRFLNFKKKKVEEEEAQASTMMQKMQRGREARKKVAGLKEERKVMTENKSANMMQKIERGRQARKMYNAKLFQIKHKEENKASTVLQSKMRQRDAKKKVAKIREEKRKKDKADRAREAKERKRMGKCDFDADKVGWELDSDRWSMLNRPLSYAELMQQEVATRKRGKVVEKNLVRVAGKFDEGDLAYKQKNWYSEDTVFDAAGVDSFGNYGSAADVGDKDYREENIVDLPPKELKEAQMTVPSDLSFLYDLQQSWDHKEWPPVWLTDTWDWGSHMKGVEKNIGIGKERPPPPKRLGAIYTHHLGAPSKPLDSRSIDEVSYYSHARYPILTIMNPHRRLVVSIEKNAFVYLQVPIVNKECMVDIKINDYVEGGKRVDLGGCDTELYVSENSLPTYFTYDFKDERIPRRMTIYPHDRVKINTEQEERAAEGTGSLFVGLYSETGGKTMIEIRVTTEVEEPSKAMDGVEEKVEYLNKLSNHSAGELVSKFSDITLIASSETKRIIADRKEFNRTGKLKAVEDAKAMGLKASNPVIESSKVKAWELEKTRREIAVGGLIGIYQDGIKVTAVDVEDSGSKVSREEDDEGEIFIVPGDVSKALTVSAERMELRLGSDIDMYSYDQVMNYVRLDEANKRMAREKKHRQDRILVRGSDDESSITTAGSVLLGQGGVDLEKSSIETLEGPSPP